MCATPSGKVEVLFIPLAITGYVRNITIVLECCQILKWARTITVTAEPRVEQGMRYKGQTLPVAERRIQLLGRYRVAGKGGERKVNVGQPH